MSKNKSVYNKGDSMLLDENINYTRLFNYYKSLTLNRFKWNNLPNNLESRYFESALFNNGQAFFYKDLQKGFVILPCSDIGERNIYNESEFIMLEGHNFKKQKAVNEGVRIYENDLKTPSIYHITHYCDLLNEIEISINMNLVQQRFPYIVPVTKKNQLSLTNLYESLGIKIPPVVIDEKLNDSLHNENGINLFNTNVPYVLDKLTDFKTECINELYDFLGLNNTNESKKERLLVDEVNANNQSIHMALDTAFKQRKLACEYINKKFNLNISVEKTINEIDVNFKGDEKNDIDL